MRAFFIANRSSQDYVWLQRKPLAPFLVNMIVRRSRLIYDFDDALYTRQSTHVGKLKDKHPGSPAYISRINHLLGKSSLVFGGSNALCDYARRYASSKSVFLVPTSLERPASVEPSFRIPGQVTVGWIGSTGNLPYLRLIDEAVHDVQKRIPHIRFSVMSGKPPNGLKGKWEFVPWSPETELQWLESIDIGVMPLKDDEWSRGKCALKLLQYMSQGKPVIASAVGENLTVVDEGYTGFLAYSMADWIVAFEKLVTDIRLRCDMGAAGGQRFMSMYERSVVQSKLAEMVRNG
ncbi:MAG: glycosyl transferase [Prosthecochloris sp.]|uniref:glycosyltransferase family 4 protein n=1 Tax=Prosthecochloris sp. TaxID=290513 RepID=UPI0013CB01FD|nr:glycosyltransferase family 4 protein [Prosthecochloris sp.]NEX13082.1 glycosyl transferase [Prosthecochloris sp.]